MPAEIRDWAYTADAELPCEDWDLALLWTGFEDLFLEFAADDNCPNSQFFLSMLYLMVGDSVRRGLDHQVEFNMQDFIRKASNYDHEALRVWSSRSQDLLRHPERFDYGDWCGGRLASESGNQ
mgnify:CR=1 FL=1